MTWSRLNWADCDPHNSLQKYKLDPKSGLWTDDATGRCMSVLDKKQPPGDGSFGKVVLDTCDGSSYGGSPSGQKWTPDPANGVSCTPRLLQFIG